MAYPWRGSSPLARGTPAPRQGQHRDRGLIPARAGNTDVPGPAGIPGRAHPRSRGEHRSTNRKFPGSSGSSPLARGTRGHAHQPVADQGLIPARAGNTLAGMLGASISRAHPRSRGEHVSAAKTSNRPQGSSPLARGPPAQFHGATARYGLIPARAGTTG